MYPADNSGYLPPPTPSTDYNGDVRHQGPATQEPTMATPGSNLEALANLQANKLQKTIESLQCIAEARKGTNTPTAPQHPHVAAKTGEE